MDTVIAPDAPSPRLCHIRKWEGAKDYGCDLAKELTGRHLITSIDPGAVAEASGLREKDIIIEVNNENVSDEEHEKVLQKIAAVENEVKFLVVDEEAYLYYKEKEIPIHGGMPNIEVITTPVTREESVKLRASKGLPTPRVCSMTLDPDFDGFGFNVETLKSQPGKHFITAVEDNSPASKCGLNQGDKIIEVNGVSVTGDGQPRVIELIKNNNGRLDLLVVDSKNAFHQMRRSIYRSGMANGGMEGPSGSRSGGSMSKVGPLGLRLCHIKKWADYRGYGLELSEKKGQEINFVSRIVPGSPAEAAGVRLEDRVIEVNGVNVKGVGHAALVEHTQTYPDHVKLLLIDPATADEYKNKGTDISGYSPNIVTLTGPDEAPKKATVPPKRIILKKTKGSYGFDLNQYKGMQGNYIGKVTDKSAAAKHGLVQGEQLIEVNGESVVNDTIKEIITKVKKKPNEVELLLASIDTSTVHHSNALWVETRDRNTVVMVPTASNPQPSTSSAPPAAPIVEYDKVNAPPLKLCVVKTWANYAGCGFELHDEKGVSGHFIHNVQPGSPAELSGLRSGDKLVEVNGESVFQDDHHQVVAKLKSNPNEVRILVLDPKDEQYFISRNLKPHGGMKYNLITGPEVQPDGPPQEEVVQQAIEDNSPVDVHAQNNIETPESITDMESGENINDRENGEIVKEMASEDQQQETQDVNAVDAGVEHNVINGEGIDEVIKDKRIQQIQADTNLENAHEANIAERAESMKEMAQEKIEKTEVIPNTDDIHVTNIAEGSENIKEEAHEVIQKSQVIPNPEDIRVADIAEGSGSVKEKAHELIRKSQVIPNAEDIHVLNNVDSIPVA